MSKEAMKLALEALKGYRRELNDGQPCDAEKALEEALAKQEQCMDCGSNNVGVPATYDSVVESVKAKQEQGEKELPCVYKATTKKGETAHFGEYSAAKAWAGWGTVERLPLKTLTLIEKPSKPCGTCEALARTVMLDQTSHDTTPQQRTWVGLTEEDLKLLSAEWRIVYGAWMDDFARDIEAKLKEKNSL
jgi:hypothetical protein